MPHLKRPAMPCSPGANCVPVAPLPHGHAPLDEEVGLEMSADGGGYAVAEAEVAVDVEGWIPAGLPTISFSLPYPGSRRRCPARSGSARGSP